MAATEVKVQMQQRRDTAAGWTSANPTLLSGELGFETDTKKVKIGDGSTAWNSLNYYAGFSISAYPLATTDIADDAITADKLADTAVTAGSYTAADITVDAQGRITAAASGTVGTSEISDGSITSAKLDTNIDIAGTLDVTGVGTFDGNVTIEGNLTVNGTQTVVNSTTLQVDDKNIELGSVTTPTDVTADGGGITLKGATDKTINWVNSTDAWTFSEHINIASGKEFRIAGTKVLDATSLGSAVVSSSLSSVGTITTGVWNGTAIATAYIADDAVTAAKLADTAVTAGSYTAADITVDAQGRITAAASGQVGTGEIADGSITTAKIADDAVTAAKLADTAVTAGSYTAADITVDAQGRITSAASGTISTAEIADDAVTAAKLADTAVTAGSYTAADITVDAQGRITAAASGTISTAEIADDAVTAAKMADTAVTAGSYTLASITVDAQGRLTSASSGTAADTDKITEGNTEAEVVDTGTDGHFKVTTEGTERVRVGPAGQIGIAGANYGTSGQVLTSGGASGAISWADAASSGGATGGGSDKVFQENLLAVDSDYTVGTNIGGSASVGSGASCVGPITVASGVTLTVRANSRLVVL